MHFTFYAFLLAALQMFLRNLEILSGMKLNICSLLLIFCISAGDLNICKNKPKKPGCAILNKIIASDPGNGNDVKGIFILGTDGFMGYFKTGDSNGNVKY